MKVAHFQPLSFRVMGNGTVAADEGKERQPSAAPAPFNNEETQGGLSDTKFAHITSPISSSSPSTTHEANKDGEEVEYVTLFNYYSDHTSKLTCLSRPPPI